MVLSSPHTVSLFAFRVWKLGRNLYITAAVYGLDLRYRRAHLDDFEKFTQISVSRQHSPATRSPLNCLPKYIFYIAVSAAILADAMIASSQVVILWKMRTTFKSIMAVACLVTYVSMPDTFIYVAIYHIVSGSTYNARSQLRSVREEGQALDVAIHGQGNSLTRSMRHIACTDGTVRTRNERTIEISVVTATDTKVDPVVGISSFDDASSLSG
ncbi:hypothetical protein CERSUDRAFT_74391 [Gelatoporia subvermispora B]|uniref:Uncharacterized protein n=1 Tax=Ceriporiopsis subvermispora (strain B) TaxID=914234 RepID=M2QWD5_CERS8|nr:hypothetical protein CERSUDRAFT_74391 [Gelatoporia subvermispora B]